MTRQCFELLYQCITYYVNERKFKYEAYIDSFLIDNIPIYNAYSVVTGGYIYGKAKIDMTLCILTGGDAIDLVTIFDINSDHCIKLIYEFLTHWIIPSDIGIINMTKYLGGNTTIARVSLDCSKRSKYVLKGDIGTLYG